jgi:cysteine-rich repeat protein
MRRTRLRLVLASIGATVVFAAPAVAVCPDSVVQPPEECDDGNASSGDGCFATCQFEDELALAGVAQGGGGNAVKLWIFGLSARIFPSAGQGALSVAADLAAQINADPTLSGVGVAAVAIDNRVVTNGSISGVLIKDLGIVQCAAEVPSSNAAWLALLVVVLAGAAFRLRAAGEPR